MVLKTCSMPIESAKAEIVYPIRSVALSLLPKAAMKDGQRIRSYFWARMNDCSTDSRCAGEIGLEV
jgi:hypothetical protein